MTLLCNLFFFYSALKEAGKYVDYLFVKFYNNFCNTGDPSSFRAALDKWLSFAQSKIRPLVFVGLPAHSLASMSPTHYRKPRELQVIYEVCSFKVIYVRLKRTIHCLCGGVQWLPNCGVSGFITILKRYNNYTPCDWSAWVHHISIKQSHLTILT